MGAESRLEKYPISLEDPRVQIRLEHLLSGETVEDVATHLFLYEKSPAAGYNDLFLLVQGEDDPRIGPLKQEGKRFVFFGNTVEIGNPQTKEVVRKVFALIYCKGHFREFPVNLTDLWHHENDVAVMLEMPEGVQKSQKTPRNITRGRGL